MDYQYDTGDFIVNRILSQNGGFMLNIARSSCLLHVLIVSSVATLAPASHAFASTFYVSTSGSDTNLGTSASPLRTIAAGTAHLKQGGDTLFVEPGTYNEVVNVYQSGSADNPIKIIGMQDKSGNQPFIDGQGTLPSGGHPLVALRGNYIDMKGFEVRNSAATGIGLVGNYDRIIDSYIHDNLGDGIMLIGQDNVATNNNVYRNYQAGILAEGDNSVVQYNTAWENAYLNCRAPGCPPSPYPNGGWATGISAARSPVDGITKHAVLRRNTVYNNWGEGLSTFEANGTILEDNIVYDNWVTNTYISDATNVVFRRNLIYSTANPSITPRQKTCLEMKDERPDKPRSDHNTVVNNMCLGGDFNIFTANTKVPGSGLTDALIADNTIINGFLETGPINTNSFFVDNIVHSGGSTIAIVPSAAGLTFSNNLWSTLPPLMALGSTGAVGDADLSKAGSINPGALTIAYFVLPPNSQAIGKGVYLGAVPQDAFGNSRKSTVMNSRAPAATDIGAYEHGGAASSCELSQEVSSYRNGNMAAWSQAFAPQHISCKLPTE